VGRDLQPVAIALVEAKPENKSPGFGLEQGKRDGDCGRIHRADFCAIMGKIDADALIELGKEQQR